MKVILTNDTFLTFYPETLEEQQIMEKCHKKNFIITQMIVSAQASGTKFGAYHSATYTLNEMRNLFAEDSGKLE